MISFIKGKLVEKTPNSAIIDCHGVGYELRISSQTYEQLRDENCSLIAHYAVSVDVRSGASTHQLYGFISKEERDIFRQLISVSGVSSGIAMTIMSSMNLSQLQRAIINKDDKIFKSVKGIGPKLAQRIVMDLCEKVLVSDVLDDNSQSVGNMAKQEALAALCSLGFDRVRADKTLNALINDSDIELGVEDLIKKSLQAL
ncbi:MAG: Holliday junction branch migration protein RuvA [Flavobacteriales bacterium]|nr:Holliday junction branch migration protein RuvA [Flavobacteriales bacterium]